MAKKPTKRRKKGTFSPMPILKNTRHERFAQNKAKGMSIGPAYTAAGYKAKGHSAEVNGARLLKNAEVKNRIAELQNRAAEKTGYTIVKATVELEEARQLAVTEKNPAAMVSASMGKAKVNGLLVDKHLVGMKRIEDMNENELRALLGVMETGRGSGA
jgi:hypothetical protein